MPETPSPPIEQVLFVVGCPRSGTTWLQSLLCTSPAVRSGRETHLFTKYIAPLVRAFNKDSADDHNGDGMKAYFSRSEFGSEILAPIARTVLGRIGADSGDAGTIVEKTPGHVMHPFLIRELVPEARLVHLIRDPRAVVASWKAAAREPWGHWARIGLPEMCNVWINHVGSRDKCAAAFEDAYREIRYEDLLAEPAPIIESLLAWAGLPAGDLAEALGQLSVSEMRKPGEGLARSLVDIAGRPNFVRKGEAEGWREELSAADIEQIELRCGEMMRRLGYRLVESTPEDKGTD